MAGNFSAIAVLFQPMAVMITLIYGYSVFSRLTQSVRLRNALMGMLFGFAALLAMEMPIELGDGIIIDLRNLFIGLAAALVGWMAGLIALLVGLTMRIYLGGVGMSSGVFAMLLTFAGAMIWRTWLRPRISVRSLSHVALGLTVSMNLLGVILLPSDIAGKILQGFAPIIVGYNLLGALLVGEMFHREGLAASEHKELRIAARTDPLTNLLNRRSLVERFETLAQKSASGDGRAVLYLDVDTFKGINDTYGHQAGDEVLLAICQRVAGCLRPEDLFGRLGGDEFVVVLPNVSEENALDVAERCRAAVAATPIETSDGPVDVSISVGVEHVRSGTSFVRDLAAADAALYRAKELGRNCVSLRLPETNLALA